MKHDWDQPWGALYIECRRCKKRLSPAGMMGGGGVYSEECKALAGARAQVYLNGQPIGVIDDDPSIALPEFSDDAWRMIKPAPEPVCECGAHKVLGIAKGAVGHSSWCPWRAS